jgi:stalled ribosome rescue protein Dom34
MKTGVWLDKEKSHIINLNNGQVSFNTILSNIENFHIHGGSGTRLKGGPQDVVQDSKYLEREKHQLKKYFDRIISEIKEANTIVLFGPAETSLKFNKELTTNHKDLATKIKDVVKADSMTKNQVTAWVKDFFELES